MRLTKRLAALLLCIVLLPVSAMAEGPTGARFELSFTLDAAACPGGEDSLLGQLAPLLSALTVSGTAAFSGDCFDVNSVWLLDSAEETRTTLRLFGLPSHYGVQSSLLGDETVMINVLALLEFAMKTYAHLDLPLQRVALLAGPYVHTSAFEAMAEKWQPVLGGSGSRVIAREDVLSLAESLSDLGRSDRAFEYWVRAVALEAGYDEAIFSFLDELYDWADGFLDEDGLRVTEENGLERWETGDVTLFQRDGASWSLTLPASSEGYALSASMVCEAGDLAFTLDVSCEEPGDVLSVALTVASSPFALRYDATGDAVEENGVHAALAGERDGERVSLRLINPDTGAAFLTVSGTLVPETPAVAPSFSPGDVVGVNILSVNDNSLSEFLSAVGAPLLRGLLPLIKHAPAASCQRLMDWFETSGVLGLVASGASSEDELFDDEEDFGDYVDEFDEFGEYDDFDELDEFDEFDEESWEEE